LPAGGGLKGDLMIIAVVLIVLIAPELAGITDIFKFINLPKK
jgi:hypothetical protein